MTELNLPQRHVFIGPAQIWKRLLALLVDLAVLDFFVFSFFTDVSKILLGDSADIMVTYRMLQENTSRTSAIVMVMAIVIMLAFVYFVLLQYATGQTVGMMLLNLQVVFQVGEKEFSMPSFWQCLIRNMFLIPAMPFILLWIIDPLYLFFTKKNQRLTEWLSQTRVIEQYLG